MLLLDVACGGRSRTTLTQLRRIPAAQWALMAAGVCVSGFISASVQFEAMRFLSAAKAQPFAALQPLFAGIFGWIVLREPVSLGTAAGGVLMVAAALLGCADEAEDEPEVAVTDVGAIDVATPDVTTSVFPLESRLDVVEGAIVDEVVHPLPPARRRGLRPTLPAIAIALSLGSAKRK